MTIDRFVRKPFAAPLFLSLGLSLTATLLGGCKDDEKAGSSPKGPPPGAGPQGAGKAGAPPPAPATPAVSPAAVRDQARRIFSPLPAVPESPDNPITEAKTTLGRQLYFDTRLSKNHDISCATCHDLDHYGIDVREREGSRARTSEGHRGQLGERNTPSVYNAALHLAQFWDGRAATIEEQALMPIVNPVEMAMPNKEAVVAVLESIPGYVEAFAAAFPEAAKPVSAENLAAVIGAYERQLLTPSKFDKFLVGDLTALSDAELQGLKTFIDVGCVQCHTGPAVGGTQFQKLGLIKPWPNLTDEGRGGETKVPADKFVFKVPSLRNVTETGPYLHDGSVASLDEIIAMMGEYQSAYGKLEPAQVQSIKAFLGSLRGELPKELITPVPPPESGPKTPAPDPT